MSRPALRRARAGNFPAGGQPRRGCAESSWARLIAWRVSRICEAEAGSWGSAGAGARGRIAGPRPVRQAASEALEELR
eukprot:354039-Pyramimonas_sp.AAC.1